MLPHTPVTAEDCIHLVMQHLDSHVQAACTAFGSFGMFALMLLWRRRWCEEVIILFLLVQVSQSTV